MNSSKTWFKKFIDKVDDIYGLYLDCARGFNLNNKQLEDLQKKFSKKLQISIAKLDSRRFTYGKGDPSKNDSVLQHICTQGENKKRNKKDGKSSQMIANLCLVVIYNYWEDYYREKIMKAIGKENKNDIGWDIMGDLRYFRNSIIHNQGVANPNINKCKLLKWFKKGKKIKINGSQMNRIIYFIKNTNLKLKKGKEARKERNKNKLYR